MRPELQLFDPDGSHPSTIGTYLTACAFYAFLSGNEATGLPARVIAKDRNGESLYLNIQSKNNAAFIQNAVDRHLQSKLGDD